jgi:hypothetical protein
LLAPPGVAAPTPSAPLTRALLLERCEGDFLESCGCVASAARFKKREVRFNTKRVYVQRKFNLLREESEGYAKLIAALAAIREGPEPPPPPEEDDDSAAEEKTRTSAYLASRSATPRAPRRSSSSARSTWTRTARWR